MKYELHPACSAWPTMKPEELRDLADDIAAHGLRDPITLTPDGLLLDGRNRALACQMADVETATTIFDGDPWLFSLSRNMHRRHMTIDQIAMVAAELATRTVGNPNLPIASNEAIGNAEAAKAAGVPETAIDSAKVVLQHGTPDEKKAVESGEARLRKTADRIRARRRASGEPDRHSKQPGAPLGKKTRVHSRDPIDDVTRELITKCAGPKAEWLTLDRMSSITKRAKGAIKDALKRLGDAVKKRVGDKGDEYSIDGDRDELLVRAGLMMEQPERRAEITSLRDENARLRAENADLRAKLADANAEIERLKNVEMIAAKPAANGETIRTVDDVVMAARGRAFKINRAEPPIFGEKEIA
jgi:hypothetical protein